MTLDVKQTDPFLGQLIWCRPYPGWSWGQRSNCVVGETDIFTTLVQPAGDFRVRVKDFFDMLGERRGFVSVVEEQGHPFDGLYLIALTMHRGVFNFEDKICARFDVEIGSEMPRDDIGGIVNEGYFGHIWAASTIDDIDLFCKEFGMIE